VQLPFVTIIHDLYPEVAIRLGSLRRHSLIVLVWERLTRTIFVRSAGLIVIGRDMEGLVRHKLKNPATDKVTLIPHWAESDPTHTPASAVASFRQEQGVQDKFVVQYTGRMGRLHNLELLIEAAYTL